ncbi:hypothetical protein COCC4DRAFT_69688 [Bipolaris maydis ATCC 48331]|uniref:Protein kinase domain-containing protein n=2 Tax=Cochliobolus heterostrophus TaxID=5016 RepID=M2UWY8_COCH5|nr:uncharacterized protein COCC4DRAFT_69688 [Bipolaris maydis ATCC 48331]EMD92317.1 hypothetical protein COCHEDRAFT_1134701 [Bipolaris maydis C5]KAH7550929.1 hypothetical protein BM1_10302 [Bipolaris maydis]ENI08008.1 hypothetical protein COCC4DRAFT_69688 [Bipolaris maydis ATCC 48331]KAJ6210114.1 kinase-like domain-containing protein [Bipolaris maydis]KAJ6272344.1 kinase-like domain-containing protein [Bipolaris maydis]
MQTRVPQQDATQQLCLRSEQSSDIESNKLPSRSPDDMHLSSRDPTYSNANHAIAESDGDRNEALSEEKTVIASPRAPNMRKNVVSPVLFIQKWARTHLPQDAPIAQLPKKLAEATVKTHFQHRFIPNSHVRDIVTAEAVRIELEKSNYSTFRRIHKNPVTTEDHSAYKKILTILYLIKKPSKIRMFVTCGVCDKDLPLVIYQGSNRPHCLPELRSRDNDSALPIIFRRRDYTDDFFHSQWRVLAPVFARDEEGRDPRIVLEPEVILPFISHSKITEGGFSNIYKTEIHPDHHSLGTNSGNVFAIKELKSSDQEAFSQEATVLDRISNKRHAHKHLITLLTTFQYAKKFHFIFPWADADLFEFWKRHEKPPSGEMMDMWIIEQCRGLADALNSIHRYATTSGTTLFNVFHLTEQVDDDKKKRLIRTDSAGNDHHLRSLFGRHGDIKPENILWYPCENSTGGHGVLKIADFGVVRFNTVNSWETHKTGRIPNTQTYRSPEMDLDGNPTTACDVWALGCVFLEFVTWYCGGNKLVEWFGKRRLVKDPRVANMETDTFFILYIEQGQIKAKVKPAVIEVIETLQANKTCTRECRELLDMIQADMLVVQQQEAPTKEDNDVSRSQEALFSSTHNRTRLGGVRRKSCGDIWRKIGDIESIRDQKEGLTRYDTFVPASPVAESHYMWSPKTQLASAMNALEISSGG